MGWAQCHAQGRDGAAGTHNIPTTSGGASRCIHAAHSAPTRDSARTRPSGRPRAKQPRPSVPSSEHSAPTGTVATPASLATWEHPSIPTPPGLPAGRNACTKMPAPGTRTEMEPSASVHTQRQSPALSSQQPFCASSALPCPPLCCPHCPSPAAGTSTAPPEAHPRLTTPSSLTHGIALPGSDPNPSW